MRQAVKRIAASQAANQPYARPEPPVVMSRFFRAPVPAKSGLTSTRHDKLERRRRWSRLGPDCRSGYFTPGSVGDLGTVEGR